MDNPNRITVVCERCGIERIYAKCQIRDGPPRFCRECFNVHKRAHPEIYQLPEAEFWNRVEKTRGCWFYMGPTRGQRGYGAWKSEYAHRYSWRLSNGPIPKGLWVLHRCDNTKCVRPDHLWLGTHEDNMREMSRRGRSCLGDRNPARLYPDRTQRGVDRHNAKLNPARVRKLRALYAAATPVCALARRFGVNHTTVLAVIQGKTWKHVA